MHSIYCCQRCCALIRLALECEPSFAKLAFKCFHWQLMPAAFALAVNCGWREKREKLEATPGQARHRHSECRLKVHCIWYTSDTACVQWTLTQFAGVAWVCACVSVSYLLLSWLWVHLLANGANWLFAGTVGISKSFAKFSSIKAGRQGRRA